MRSKRGRGIWLVALGMILIALGMAGLLGAPEVLEYLAPAQALRAEEPEASAAPDADEDDVPQALPPDARATPNAALYAALEQARAALLELSGNLNKWTASGEVHAAQLVSDTDASADARLVAAGEGYFSVYPRLLLVGRLPSPEELTYGAPVMALDEQLALKLFGISEPIDREVTWEGVDYQVIGVVRHTRSPGEAQSYSAYVPVMQMVKQGAAVDMLALYGVPIPKSGASVAFEAALTQQFPGGGFFDLSKEAQRGWMLLRLCLILIAAYLLVALIRRAVGYMGVCVRDFSARLHLEYARDMLPGLTLRLAGGLLLLAAACAGAYVLALITVDPVYLFPEWVPPVLVEWEDLRATFWNLVAAAARPVTYRSVEFIQIGFYATLVRWGLIAALLGAFVGRLPDGRVRRDKA